MIAVKKAVIPPSKHKKTKIKELYSKIGELLKIKKTPAVTIVAACNKELTGVGPSIASGNQVCKPNWADFPIPPIKRKMQIKVTKFILKRKKLQIIKSTGKNKLNIIT
jgi:hypothetical protein